MKDGDNLCLDGSVRSRHALSVRLEPAKIGGDACRCESLRLGLGVCRGKASRKFKHPCNPVIWFDIFNSQVIAHLFPLFWGRGAGICLCSCEIDLSGILSSRIYLDVLLLETQKMTKGCNCPSFNNQFIARVLHRLILSQDPRLGQLIPLRFSSDRTRPCRTRGRTLS